MAYEYCRECCHELTVIDDICPECGEPTGVKRPRGSFTRRENIVSGLVLAGVALMVSSNVSHVSIWYGIGLFVLAAGIEVIT